MWRHWWWDIGSRCPGPGHQQPSRLCVVCIYRVIWIRYLPLIIVINSLAPGKCADILKVWLPNSLYRIADWALAVKLLQDLTNATGECHRTSLIGSQHYVRLYAVRQRTLSGADVDRAYAMMHDDVINWKHFPLYWPSVHKQSRRRWFETPLRSLWCQCNWPMDVGTTTTTTTTTKTTITTTTTTTKRAGWWH